MGAWLDTNPPPDAPDCAGEEDAGPPACSGTVAAAAPVALATKPRLGAGLAVLRQVGRYGANRGEQPQDSCGCQRTPEPDIRAPRSRQGVHRSCSRDVRGGRSPRGATG